MPIFITYFKSPFFSIEVTELSSKIDYISQLDLTKVISSVAAMNRA